MEILPLSPRLRAFLQTRGITKQFEKQLRFFRHDPFYPSLHAEVLEPHHLRIYSFRVTKKYRAIFIYREPNSIEIIDINDHYQ